MSPRCDRQTALYQELLQAVRTRVVNSCAVAHPEAVPAIDEELQCAGEILNRLFVEVRAAGGRGDPTSREDLAALDSIADLLAGLSPECLLAGDSSPMLELEVFDAAFDAPPGGNYSTIRLLSRAAGSELRGVAFGYLEHYPLARNLAGTRAPVFTVVRILLVLYLVEVLLERVYARTTGASRTVCTDLAATFSSILAGVASRFPR